MIKHFLQLGGVNSIEEFYKKFPTEAHFDNHVHKMKNGGMYAYKQGGQQNIPKYAEGSIVDYLASKGQAFDKESRAKLAAEKGIKNYDFSAEKNLELLNSLQNNSTSLPTPAKTENSKNMPALPKKQKQQAVNVPPANFATGYLPSFMQAPPTPDRSSLQSGMIEDKGANLIHVIKNGKITKSFPILTGKAGKNKNTDKNTNVESLAYLEKHPEGKSTPVGTYFSSPNPSIYGSPGFNMNPIAAYGQPAPQAKDLAQHVTYPEEFGIRNPLYSQPADKRYASYGCTNMQGEAIDCITKEFPRGDTTMVIDSRNRADANLLKKYGKKYGGASKQNDTYSAGVSYDDGGYVPQYGDNAYGVLPQYGMGAMGVPEAMYGMGMKAGGAPCYECGGNYANGGQPDLQSLIDAGYNLDYLAYGGPTYSKVTAYNHQGYVPAFDWLKEGGPTFSKHTGYPHQQYVPALDWLQEGGAPMSPDEAAAMQQQQGEQPQGAGSIDPQQLMQMVSQKLQQGQQPEQIMQQLVQQGVPQDIAQQVIQQVMQQMQGAQQQPQQGMMRNGGLVKGSVHDVSNEDVQDLINKGYKIQYL